jgi:plasmid stability protein
LSYNVVVRKTLTVRTDEDLREALQERAELQGTSVSELAREILRAAVVPTPLAVRAGHLRGKLELGGRARDPWRRALRRRNWRP